MEGLKKKYSSDLVKESDIFLCQACGAEIDKGRIFCEIHNEPIHKQIYSMLTELPSKEGILIRPRGEKLYSLISLYLAARLDLIDNRRIILKSISGVGKSYLMDMIAFIELTHFPDSLTVIGSISDSVSKEHILRLRHWVSNSVFARYMSGTREATASKTEIKLAKLNSRIIAMPQSEETRSGWHPTLLLVDEIGRMRSSAYYYSFFQMGRMTGVLEILASTPFLDSQVMQTIWNSKNIMRLDLTTEDCWWISKAALKDIEDSDLPPEMKEQIYQAKFRSVSNRVIPDDLLLLAFEKEKHLPPTGNLIMGVDFGKSRDPTAVVVVDAGNGDVKFAKSFELKEDWNVQFRHIRQIYDKVKPKQIVADSSAMGDVIITANLADLPIEPVSMQGSPNKRVVINKLKMAFFNKKINIVYKEFPELVNELSLYVYLDPAHTQSGPTGRAHDDLVDALALALRPMDVSDYSRPFDASIWDISSATGGSGGDSFFDENKSDIYEVDGI